MKALESMKRWLADARLAGVPDQEAIARFPAEEREGWAKLWKEAEALWKKACERSK
jgi:hypothetical protein